MLVFHDCVPERALILTRLYQHPTRVITGRLKTGYAVELLVMLYEIIKLRVKRIRKIIHSLETNKTSGFDEILVNVSKNYVSETRSHLHLLLLQQ